VESFLGRYVSLKDKSDCSTYGVDGIDWISTHERYNHFRGRVSEYSERSYWRCRLHSGGKKKDS